MKKTVNTHEAKTQLSQLLKRVGLGEEITIATRGKPVARLVPVTNEGTGRGFGMFKGKFVVPDDFDSPLPEDLLDLFEGKTKRKGKRKKA